tara:strand:- start:405 stop:548 length:144 start_codon:yes stop_codon:yes gene_type:complete
MNVQQWKQFKKNARIWQKRELRQRYLRLKRLQQEIKMIEKYFEEEEE